MKKYFAVLSLVLALACKKNDLQVEIPEPKIEFTSEQKEIAPASFLILTSTQKIKKDSAIIQIGSSQATLIKLDSSRMGMWIPVIPSGNYSINLNNAGGQDSFALRILPINPIADPAVFLTELQEDARRINDSLDRFQRQGILSVDDLKFISELKNRIDAGLSRLTPSQSEQLAYLVKESNTISTTFTLPTLDSALSVPRINQVNTPTTEFTNVVNILLPIHQNINRLSSVNLTAAEFWDKRADNAYELAYLLSLELYMLEKYKALVLNKQISTFACIVDPGLIITEGAIPGSNLLKVIRGRSINQRIQGTFRTINSSDQNLLNGQIAQLYNLNSGLANSDVTIGQRWSGLKSRYNDLMNSVPSSFNLYASPLPVSSTYKSAEIPASALVITEVSNLGISVVPSVNTDGSLRLSFNSTANTIPDGTNFSIQINYNQGPLARSAGISQTLSFDNYPNVTIGGKIWMQENAAVKVFRNGDPIPYVSWGPTWATLKTPAWCYYNNDPNSETTYGLLYNWYVVSDARGFAPEGWHVATDTEWKDMIAFLGGNAVAGGKIKAVSPLWIAPNIGATNSSGFTALPAGTRGNGGTYVSLGKSTAWWTANEYGPNGSWSYYAGNNTSSVTRGGASKQDGYSVRFVKD